MLGKGVSGRSELPTRKGIRGEPEFETRHSHRRKSRIPRDREGATGVSTMHHAERLKGTAWSS